MDESSKLIASVFIIQCPLAMKIPYHGDNPAWRELAIEKITGMCSKTKPAHVLIMRGASKIGLPGQLSLELMDKIQGILMRRHYVTVDAGAKLPDLLTLDQKKNGEGRLEGSVSKKKWWRAK